MRDQIREELATVRYSRFLVFLMGPYTSFPIDQLLSRTVGEKTAPLPSVRATSGTVDDMLALLRRVQGSLRRDPGVNAFLAVDANVPLNEIDAASQSIRFARESNVVAFIVPQLGANFGVGMEVGAVLEDLYPDSERVVLIHDARVTSAMLDAVHRRWDATVISYETEGELIKELRYFVGDIMLRETIGDLPRKKP